MQIFLLHSPSNGSPVCFTLTCSDSGPLVCLICLLEKWCKKSCSTCARRCICRERLDNYYPLYDSQYYDLIMRGKRICIFMTIIYRDGRKRMNNIFPNGVWLLLYESKTITKPNLRSSFLTLETAADKTNSHLHLTTSRLHPLPL